MKDESTATNIDRMEDAVTNSIERFETAMENLAEKVEEGTQRLQHIVELGKKQKDDLMHLRDTSRDIIAPMKVTAQKVQNNPRPYILTAIALACSALAVNYLRNRSSSVPSATSPKVDTPMVSSFDTYDTNEYIG